MTLPTILNMTKRNATRNRVSQTLSVSIEQNTETTVKMEESVCGMLWEIIWRRVSVSFV